jgi:hypothetical protein
LPAVRIPKPTMPGRWPMQVACSHNPIEEHRQ